MGKQQLTITIPECLNMEGLERRGNYRIIGYQQELLHVLEHKHAAAFVLTALLRWTKRKRDDLLQTIMRLAENKQPPMQEEEMEIWVHMSFEGFADEFDGLFSHNTIKDAVGYLIKHEIIFQRKNINPRFKDYEYRVNLPKVRDLIQALPTHPVLRQRDNRKRDQKRSTKIGDSNNEPPKQAVSPKLANIPPKSVDMSPKLAAESPELANHYTMSTQSLTKSNTKRENSQRDQPPTQKPSLSSPQRNKSLLSEQEEAIIVHWEEIIESAAPRTAKTIEAAKTLASCNATKEDLIAVRDFCLRTNPEWYEKNGIDLATIVRNWSKWKSTVKRTAEKNKTIGGYTIYQPDPNQKDLPFVGTERQRKQREQERKSIPAEHKNVYEGVYTSLQQLGATVQEAHDDARVIVEHHRRYGYTIGQEQLDALIDHLMQEVKGLDEPEYVKQNILGNTIIELASKANRKAGNLA